MGNETAVVARDHAALVHDDDDSDAPVARKPAAPPAIGLTLLDRINALAFVDGDKGALDQIVDLVRESAAWLAGPEGDASRRRLISREVACSKVAVDILNASVGERVKAGSPADLQAAVILDKLATSAARRACLWIEALRREGLSDGRQPVLTVGVNVAPNVFVKAGP